MPYTLKLTFVDKCQGTRNRQHFVTPLIEAQIGTRGPPSSSMSDELLSLAAAKAKNLATTLLADEQRSG